jgi:hypothetical protein
MGTITGISDLDPVRWPNSHWRSVKVWCRLVLLLLQLQALNLLSIHTIANFQLDTVIP